MKIVIIEDELPALNRLRKMISEIAPETEVIATADSIESALRVFTKHAHIDLAFMDIELADGQSFEIFNQVQVKCPVIFTTAYDEYAIKAFKVNSIDYLLKPVAKEELAAAIQKYKNLQNNTSSITTDFVNLLTSLQPATAFKQRFLVRSGQKLVSLACEDIAYFQSKDKLSFLYTHEGKKYVVDYTLEELNKLLDERDFFQLNRQFIASFRSIGNIHSWFNGKLKIDLSPAVDEEVIVSREKAPELKKWLDK